MSETADIIFCWLKDEFPQAGWTGTFMPAKQALTAGITEHVYGVIGGITLELKIQPKELVIGIYTKPPRTRPSKIREVTLTDPTSIESLQEVVRHTIKITTNPYLGPQNAGPR